VLYIDQLGPGGFSTPKGVLLGPEENWNANESGDATIDNPCTATRIVVGAGETRSARITMNAIHGAPAFTYLPNSLPMDLSDNGGRVVGCSVHSSRRIGSGTVSRDARHRRRRLHGLHLRRWTGCRRFTDEARRDTFGPQDQSAPPSGPARMAGAR
jgi:hypothetical protein